MTIAVLNLQKKLLIKPSRIKRIVKKVLKIGNKEVDTVSVVFVDQRKIKQLNRKFLGRDHLTDVISFDNSLKFPKRNVFWEIVISADTAIKNSQIFKTSVEYEIELYLVHGLLHQLGYDDTNSKERKRMRLKEKGILKILNSR